MLGEGLPRGVGQEEAHEAAAGQQDGDDERGRGAVRVQQRRDHDVTDDTTKPSRHHRHRYSGSAAIKTILFFYCHLFFKTAK